MSACEACGEGEMLVSHHCGPLDWAKHQGKLLVQILEEIKRAAPRVEKNMITVNSKESKTAAVALMSVVAGQAGIFEIRKRGQTVI